MKMNLHIGKICRCFLAAFAFVPLALFAQNHASQSVLSQHTWYRMGVTQEGIYKLDYNALRAMNVAADASDVDLYSITAPSDPVLFVHCCICECIYIVEDFFRESN